MKYSILLGFICIVLSVASVAFAEDIRSPHIKNTIPHHEIPGAVSTIQMARNNVSAFIMVFDLRNNSMNHQH